MKVAHVTSQLGRESAGLGAAVSAISAATKEAGNEVRVFGISSAGWNAGDSTSWSGAKAEVFDPASWSGPFGYAPLMLSALLEFNPDVVHLHGLWTYPSIATHQWHRITGRPYVVSAHGMLMSASFYYKSGRKTVARHLFQDRVLRAAAILHATSTDEQAAYRALGFDNRVELVSLGLDTVPLPEVDRNGANRRVLFLGRLHHQKGIDWLIEAWTWLERDFPDWTLSIVGPLEESFVRDMDKIRHQATGRRVSFLAPLYDAEKYRYMAGSDLFVMPSRSENFGLTAAESLMMECPVIATTGTPWSGLIAAEAGWWIKPGASALEAAMRSAMALPRAELRRKGGNGRRWIEQDFSWTVIGTKWQILYEGLQGG